MFRLIALRHLNIVTPIDMFSFLGGVDVTHRTEDPGLASGPGMGLWCCSFCCVLIC